MSIGGATAVTWTLAGVAVLGVGAAAAATVSIVAANEAAPAAATASPGATVDEAPTPTPAPTLTLPVVYTGDELAWFLFDESTVTNVFGGSAMSEPTAIFGRAPESEGITGWPEECGPLVFLVPGPVIGYRQETWNVGWSDAVVRMAVEQYPTVVQAQEEFDTWAAAAAACGDYWYVEGDTGPPMHSAVTTDTTVAETRIVVQESTSDRVDWWTNGMVLTAREGNLIVSVWLPFDAEHRIDDATLVEAMVSQVGAARDAYLAQYAG